VPKLPRAMVLGGKFLKQGVFHIVALPFTLKSIFKAKEEELWKFKYFTPCKNLIFKKTL
jgi:hypothetical protein